MKISVSLPEEDVLVLDQHARKEGLPSRSAALRRAIDLLRNIDLESDYESAWTEWHETPDSTDWERSAGDGVA